MRGHIYQLIYFFSRHSLFGWTLNRWLILALLFGPLILLLTPLKTSLEGLFLLVALFLGGLSGIIAIWRMRRRGFLRFESETLNLSTSPKLLPFPEKIPIHASGSFAVSGMTRYFVEESAYYQTFQTRERVVMVQIFDTRYFWLIQSPENETGWWYTFFTPEIIQSFEPGQICFGPRKRPALRLTYLPDETETPQTLYLSFDTSEQRNQVLADLYADQV